MDQQNAEELARLWTQSQPVVSAYIVSIVRDFHLAEDIVQQVAVILVREFEKYDPAKPFLPWALGIAKNVVLKSRRQMASEADRLLKSALFDRIQTAFEQDMDFWAARRQALHECIRQQTGRLRDALRWRYGHDLSTEEISQKMGMTAGAVRVMLHRSRTTLRECIQRRLRTST